MNKVRLFLKKNTVCWLVNWREIFQPACTVAVTLAFILICKAFSLGTARVSAQVPTEVSLPEKVTMQTSKC